MFNTEKRKEPRHDFGLNIYDSEVNFLGLTNNLSRSGYSIKAIPNVKIGDRLDIYSETPESPEWINVKCLVKWKTEKNMGVEINMGANEEQIYSEFIQPWDEAFG